MFYLNKNMELTADLLSKMINRFNVTKVGQLKKYKNYYDGIQIILQKKYADPTKPTSRIVSNICKNITDSYCGYLATAGYISYRSDNDIQMIMDILRYNDYQYEDNAFLLDALVYGIAYELMYIDEQGKTRFRLIDPTTCFGVCDDSLTGDLTHFVRMYKASEWDDSDKYLVDVYSNDKITTYSMTGRNGNLTFVAETPHHFSQCPANIFSLQDEKSVFDCVIGIQDAYNEVLSSEVDDFSAFCDAYMVLTGVQAEEEDLLAMKQNRVMLLPDNSDAEWLTKNISDTQVENILKRLHETAYRIAQCPDFSSDSFNGGVSSGVSIRYKLTGMENRAGSIEASMRKALQRRIEIICGIASLTMGEEVFRDIQIDFKRNIPVDVNEKIALVNALKNIVSDKTLLGQLDFVEDVDAELEAVEAQKKEQMSLYSFHSFGAVNE